jgi:hypothetical protein
LKIKSLAVVLLCVVILACASKPEIKGDEDYDKSALQYASEAGVVDDRGRFREVFCAVLEEHGQDLPDYRSCDQALRKVGNEAGATGASVALGDTGDDFLFLLVPGLGWECVVDWLDIKKSAYDHVATFGYEGRVLQVDGLSSTENNARQIRDQIMSLSPEDASRRLILAGYSKGAPDILTAIAAYPEVSQRVTAVVSLAGSVRGSPLADQASQSDANIMMRFPGSNCDAGDEGAVASLKPAVREQWLEENPLPEHIRYYSVVTYPHEDNVSWGLKNSYVLLSGFDARNDTQVLIYDQMIPGSKLLAFLNADHWAIAVPVNREHSLIASTLVNHNDYPREALLEALLRYLEEDLSASSGVN